MRHCVVQALFDDIAFSFQLTQSTAMSCFPFRTCLECLQGPSFATANESYAHLREEVHCVKLDTSFMGREVILLKAGTRICGSGGALATAPIVQNKAYFQATIQVNGIWGIGLATRSANLSNAPILENAWMLHHDGRVYSNGEELGVIDLQMSEGDSIGVAFDHIDLRFFKNNEELPITIPNIRGQVYPCVFVEEAASIDVKFRTFDLNPPPGYEEIMIEQTLL
uniref:SPRY domain-containing protein n=1 Tax=Panagrellus redivivus TaxID=6233 RepID=A0A7E4W716_PANRE